VLILALDTTTRAGSAAVLDDDTVRAVVDGDPSRTHGERLPLELEVVLQRAGVALGDIALLAVARGPGAFTGLRIGLAAMQGLAMVTGRPVVGVSALEALAAEAFASQCVTGARIGAWMDAARGEVFAQAFDADGPSGGVPRLTPLGEPEVDAPQAVVTRWRGRAAATTNPAASPLSGWVLIGDGFERYRDALPEVTAAATPALAPAIGRLGRRLAGTHHHPPHDLQPLYVRRPDAERGNQP
jgi:tRNA threonylcarbamoyladenosine biosynthesis protein TsaB